MLQKLHFMIFKAFISIIKLSTNSRWLNSMLLHGHVIITTWNGYLPSHWNSTDFLLWFNLQKGENRDIWENIVSSSLNLPHKPFLPLSLSPLLSTLFPFLSLSLQLIQNAHTHILAETGYPSDQRSLWSCDLVVCEIISNFFCVCAHMEHTQTK